MAREPFAARLTTIWIGGSIFWMLKLFKGSFAEQISEKYEKRNLLLGFAIQVLALIGIIYYLYFKD